jgi:hypothetical protein
MHFRFRCYRTPHLGVTHTGMPHNAYRTWQQLRAVNLAG